jgi:hypothetical protein
MKYKIFEIETEQGTFQVKAPTSKVTEKYAKIVALHWLQKQCGIVAKELKNIKGIQL